MAQMQTLVNGRWVDSNTPEAQQYTREMEAAAAARKTAEQAQNFQQLTDLADPFRAQRGQYQTQLKDLMTNPSQAMATNPFFKASGEAGQEAAMRRLRAMGMGTSGNAAMELQKQAQANMSGDFFKLADLLGGLSGAQASPAGAAQAQLGMMQLGENKRQFDSRYNQQPVSAYGGMTTPQQSSMSNYWTSGQWNNSPFFQEQRQNDANTQARRNYYEQYGGFAP